MRANACGPDLRPENKPSQTPPHKLQSLARCEGHRHTERDGDLHSACQSAQRVPTCVRARRPDLCLILLAQIKPLVQDSVPPALSRGMLVNVRRTVHGPRRGRRRHVSAVSSEPGTCASASNFRPSKKSVLGFLSAQGPLSPLRASGKVRYAVGTVGRPGIPDGKEGKEGRRHIKGNAGAGTEGNGGGNLRPAPPGTGGGRGGVCRQGGAWDSAQS